MSDDDFSSLVGGDVNRIRLDKRVALEKDRVSKESAEVRRKAAEQEEEHKRSDISSDPIEMVDPFDVICYRRPGVQHGVYKKLRLGKYALDAQLDLHKLSVEQARKAVNRFVVDCLANDVRSALITHGKGVGRENPALLKSCVAHWLPQLNSVLAFHTAQKHHGGYGATYMLLKKSEKKKSETREKTIRKS